MKLMKTMYYVNIILLIIETITIYIYNRDLLWLCVMIMAFLSQLISVNINAKKMNK